MIMPPGQNGMMPQNAFAARLGIGAPTDPPAYPRPVMPGMPMPQPGGPPMAPADPRMGGQMPIGAPPMQLGFGGMPQNPYQMAGVPQPGMPPQTPMPMNNIRARLGM